MLGESLPTMLLRYREQYGDLFTIKTGPIRQVWICNEAIADRVYSSRACAGRSQLPNGEAPFGKDFLFLTREPEAAAPVRIEQKKWLAVNADRAKVQAALETAKPEIFAAIDHAVKVGGEAGARWPSEGLGSALLGALLKTFVDDESAGLSTDERRELLTALAGYRKRSTGPPNPFAGKVDYARQVRELLLTAQRRSGRDESTVQELLPLLVSACVGGGEIFPLLLQWTIRRLAIEPDLQAELRADLAASGKEYGSLLPQILTAVLRQCPYSTAIGPPRKVLRDFDVPGHQGVTIPAESIVFAMHPGLAQRRGELLPSLRKSVDGKTCTLDAGLRMFGFGPRACTAAETSISFLCTAVAMIIRRYEVSIMPSTRQADLLAYEPDGSLLVPKSEVPLQYRIL